MISFHVSVVFFSLLFFVRQTLAFNKLEFSGITFTNGRYCPNVTLDSNIAYDSLLHLESTGANSVSVIVTQYQTNITSTNIYPIYGTPIPCTDGVNVIINCITATMNELVNVINYIHNNLHLKVMLKPHIDLINDPNHWRADIGTGMTSNQWNEWFISYTNFILYYATIAQNTSVELFSVSCELIEASKQETYWRNLIPKIRNIYTVGKLIDSAFYSTPNPNNGELTDKKWWDLMDYIGVDEYYILKSWPFNNNIGSYPNITTILNAWMPIESQLMNLSMFWNNKSIIFTETGYCSGLNNKCANYNDIRTNNISLNQMSLFYNATFIAMSKYEWFKGIFWWNWDTDAAFGGYNNSCMTPSYKPAENILRYWYQATKQPPPPPEYPPQCQCWL